MGLICSLHGVPCCKGFNYLSRNNYNLLSINYFHLSISRLLQTLEKTKTKKSCFLFGTKRHLFSTKLLFIFFNVGTSKRCSFILFSNLSLSTIQYKWIPFLSFCHFQPSLISFPTLPLSFSDSFLVLLNKIVDKRWRCRFRTADPLVAGQVLYL